MSIKITNKKAEILKQMSLNSFEDILSYYPYRYDEYKYKDFALWKVDETVVIEGTVTSKMRISRFKGNHNVIYFDLHTNDNIFKICCFNQIWLMKMNIGDKVSIIGKYEGYNKILASSVSKQSIDEIIGIKPVYSLKDGLTNKYFNNLVKQILQENYVDNFLPNHICKKYNFIDRHKALQEIHNPSNRDNLLQAITTLKYEEFFKYNLVSCYKTKLNHHIDNKYAKKFDPSKIDDFISLLPFRLTDDQLKATEEILDDLKEDHQMNRLLQGDVGCGKTIVSFIAMYACFLAGKQAVLMAPTEILANQHYDNIVKFFKNYGINIVLLQSNMDTINKQKSLELIAKGDAKFIVGTHALFQENVHYFDLGLIITDEQHRFGVKQRQQLLLKGEYPDILLMSATPIPRTLASAIYGDLDVSTIMSCPNKNKIIHSKLITINSFTPVLDEINALLAQHNQMYVICPSIKQGLSSRSVEDIYQNLAKYYTNKYKVGLLHSKLDEQEKILVENQFKNGEIDILVSTTVVEVGVDVKNANIMVIYDANRFGLSTLHQLRGRIARGDREGYCYFLTSSQDKEALDKLEFITNNNNGFEISTYDLKMRGPGDIIGVRQSGLPTFVLGNVINDIDVLNNSRVDCWNIINDLKSYPQLEKYILSKVNDNNSSLI